MGEKRVWIVYDERAGHDGTDDAAVLDTATSRREAGGVVRWYDGAACAFSYRDDDGELVDERGPYWFGKRKAGGAQ